MPSLTVRISGKSVKKVEQLLKGLPLHDVEVLQSSETYQQTKSYLHTARQDMLTGSNPIVSLQEVKENSEKVISLHEN